MKILIIDPSDLFVARLSEPILESDSSVSIRDSNSCAEATRLLSESAPTIVLCDMHLLINDEFRFLGQLQEYDSAAKVIVLFTIADEYQLSQCRKHGVADLFEKYAEFERIPGAIRALDYGKKSGSGSLKKI